MLTSCTVTATTGLWCVAQFISINTLSTQTQDTSITNNNTHIHVCMRQKHNVAEISISINDSLLYFVPLPSAQRELHGVDWWTWGGSGLWRTISVLPQTHNLRVTVSSPSEWIETLQKNELLSIFQSKFPSVLVFLQCHFHITESCFAIEFLK